MHRPFLSAARHRLSFPCHFSPIPSLSLSSSSHRPYRAHQSRFGRVARRFVWATLGTVTLGTGILTVKLAWTDANALATEIRDMVPDAELYANADIRLPFRDRSTWSVFRSWVVFQLCGCNWLVDVAPKLLASAQIFSLAPLTHFLLRHSFFAHFCGGESLDQLTTVITSLQKQGIGSILDISIESDIQVTDPHLDPDQVRKFHELNADNAATLFSQAIDAASRGDKACIAVKVTALGPTPVLLSVASTLARVYRILGDPINNANSGMTRDQWVAAVPGGEPIFDAIVAIQDNWTTSFRRTNKITSTDLVALLTHDPSPNYLAMLGVPPSDVASFAKLLHRLRSLCEQAKQVNVPLMVDAEQTYFQPAIDIATLVMSKQFNGHNGGSPIVFHTYQLYLKDALRRLQRDLSISEKQGWHFAAKLVRGAYMISERSKAALDGYPSPVHDTINDTHAAYNAGVDAILQRIAKGINPSATCIVATHNRLSVVRTLQAMRSMGIDKHSGRVMFGQLMGMNDLTSFALAHNGYPTYKYLPYGPIHEVVPYLLRRAQENSSILVNGSVDKMILWHELVCRFQSHCTNH